MRYFNIPMKWSIALLAIIEMAGLPVQAAEENITTSERIESFVREKMRDRQIPAVSYAVVKDGQILTMNALGSANLELDVPATEDTVYQIASVTKTVTAVGVMSLAERTDLSLEDTIGMHINGLPSEWQSVTIRHLLQHTSGIPDMSVDRYTMKTVGKNRDEVLQILSNKPMMFEPGSKWSYNSTNFMLLGMLIEETRGSSYEEFVTESILKTSESVTFGGVRKIVPGRATHYTWFRFDGKRPSQASNIEVLDFSLDPVGYAGGGLNVSVSDFAEYIASLQRGEIISQASLQEIWEPVILSNGKKFKQAEGAPYSTYGLGWIINQRSHYPWAGGTGGLRSAYAWYPNENLVVIVFTNLQGSGPEAIAEGIADKLRNQ